MEFCRERDSRRYNRSTYAGSGCGANSTAVLAPTGLEDVIAPKVHRSELAGDDEWAHQPNITAESTLEGESQRSAGRRIRRPTYTPERSRGAPESPPEERASELRECAPHLLERRR
eukprot:46825-Prymnesium_polylepis.1